ncbi:MAG: hypothetical protein V8T86_10805 [Victivallis sp.]
MAGAAAERRRPWAMLGSSTRQTVVTELSLVSAAPAADDLSSARIIVKGAAEGRCAETLKLRIAETGDSVEESSSCRKGMRSAQLELTLNMRSCGSRARRAFRYTAEIEFLGKRGHTEIAASARWR